MVNGGAVVWKNCSAWSLEKMIQRSGSNARSFLPMSAATSRTCSTTFLASVSGRVKNGGAWGSLAPPITVDIMTFLLGRSRCGQARAHQVASQPENIAQESVQQGDASQPKEKQVRFAEDLSLRFAA